MMAIPMTDPVAKPPPGRANIDLLLEECRAKLPHRPSAAELSSYLEQGALLVDIRPVDQRLRDGELTGAVVIDRNVLEWRLDPTSPPCIPQVTG